MKDNSVNIIIAAINEKSKGESSKSPILLNSRRIGQRTGSVTAYIKLAKIPVPSVKSPKNARISIARYTKETQAPAVSAINIKILYKLYSLRESYNALSEP